MNQPSNDLAERARQLALVAAAYPALAERAQRLAERVDTQRFHVAVVGAFKRGKSTVINALVDRPVLPTGVLPLTAIATEVSFGTPGVTIVGLDGTRTEVAVDELASYVTEPGNPGNSRGVARAEIRVDCPLLASGLVLVDTPGLGSLHGHDADTRRAVDQSDAAIVVLAADMALAEDERQLLEVFNRRSAEVFVVVNKADHVDGSELEAVRVYVHAACGSDVPMWTISAKAAFDHYGDAGQFDDFRAAIDKFVQEDLAAARVAAAANELRDISTSVTQRCNLESAAASLDADRLDDIAERFRRLAAAERDTLAADHLLLAERCRSLIHELSARLTARARTASATRRAELEEATEGPLREIDARLDGSIETAVREELETWQADETATVDRAWRNLADAAQRRAAERIAAVRGAAADLFAIELQSVDVPNVADEPDTFSFLLTPPASMSDPYIHMGRALQPATLRRRRALKRATARLADELDKHAGRLRHALEGRLATAQSRFIAATTAALDETIESIDESITVADRARRVDHEAASNARRRAHLAASLASVGTN